MADRQLKLIRKRYQLSRPDAVFRTAPFILRKN